ncbi:MAG: DUF3426 domain-containing protein [Rhodocyclaceae bacterium]|nr:DUF3426 domain-containing protein [Rhodocyclaceae bacterium]
MILTRCPHCGTTFSATPEQLKARRGRVRCGRCQAVFDGLEALVEAPVAPPMPPPVAKEEPVEVAPVAEEGPPEAAPAEEEPVPVAEEEPTATDEASEPTPDPLPLPVLHDGKPPRRRAWPWALGIFMFALPALFIQALLHFRVELAVLYPKTKPALLAVCAVFGYDVPLPRRIDRVSIESSDLHPAGPASEGHLQLIASLRNRAPFAQAWPHLELTLTDANDRMLIRKALAPADYLPPAVAQADGFAAGAEQAVNLALDAPGVPAAGYRLYVFHP